MEAINDAFYLENAVYVLLKRYCKGKDHYVNLVELFREVGIRVFQIKFSRVHTFWLILVSDVWVSNFFHEKTKRCSAQINSAVQRLTFPSEFPHAFCFSCHLSPCSHFLLSDNDANYHRAVSRHEGSS